MLRVLTLMVPAVFSNVSFQLTEFINLHFIGLTPNSSELMASVGLGNMIKSTLAVSLIIGVN